VHLLGCSRHLWACVVVAASVGDVASVRFASHADCAKGNASGGCALIVNATKFVGIQVASTRMNLLLRLHGQEAN